MKTCERCGAGNPDDAAFCSLCYETFPVVDDPEPAAGGAFSVEGRPMEISNAPWEETRRQPRALEPAQARKGSTAIKAVAAATILLVLTVAVYAAFFRDSTPAPIPTGEVPAAIDILQEPEQIPVENGEVIHEREDRLKYMALAEYKISAKVMAKVVNCDFGKSGSGFPIDIALVWGELATYDYDEFLDYSHDNIWIDNQWLNVRYRSDSLPDGMTGIYAMSHISNNHVSPASENIYNALVRLRKGQEVLLEGYLVSTSPVDGRGMRSSLSREDSGGGACECFYVEKMTVEDAVYE
jgi:hypothetical protein